MKPRKNKQGFTLIELMVVVSLCLLITQLTITGLELFNSFIVQSELMSLRIFFQEMRWNAIHTGQERVIAIDPINHSYYNGNHVHRLSSAIRFGFLKAALGPPSSPHSAITSPVTFKNNQVHFFPDGTISSGIIYIVDSAERIGYALSNGVGAVSYLRLYKYDKGRWLLW